MSEPIIAANQPIPVQLAAGEEQHWCACGQSQNQPFCDGSHVGTEFTPVAFTPDESSEAYLCACKRTNTPPYCDRTHAQFGDELVAPTAVAPSP
jgi:CDGSH-type Zn-finger protein